MRSSRRLSFVLVILLASAGRAESPQAESVEGSSGSRLVSPSVVATWIVRKEAHGTSQLELLVLWRGTPGWFMRAGSEESSNSDSIQSTEDDRGGGTVVEQLSYGGLRLELEFDRAKRTARVQNHDVGLESANVILVDEVDAVDGPQIAGSLHVDPSLTSEPAEVEAIVRRSPEIYEFLRCDASVPDANTQEVIETLCARMKPK